MPLKVLPVNGSYKRLMPSRSDVTSLTDYIKTMGGVYFMEQKQKASAGSEWLLLFNIY